MCGICGLVYRDPRIHVDGNRLVRMADTIRHRGPDDSGVHIHGSIGLAHRRLSILDLTAAGHQPMSNEDGTIWVTFNGEIYNFQHLKRELQQRHQFKSNSDTEVLVHLYEELGERMVDRLDGMFVFAIHDIARAKVFIARDPFGIKPLFYAFDERRLVFGSEIKPLLASGEVSRSLDSGALNDFFDYLWIPAPRSIFAEIRKLPPAHVLTLDIQSWQLRLNQYWKPEYRPELGRTLDSWTDEVESTLSDSVRAQLISDVPVGAFLSGGIDSSLVARAAAAEQKLQTFTIDFADQQYSERPYAEQVAASIQSQSVVRTVNPDALDQLPQIVESFDEPFADSSMIPTFRISRITREFVKVALSGDGGDELFSGYRHHHLAHRISDLDRLPPWLSRIVFGGVARLTLASSRAHQWARRLSLSPDLRRMTLLSLPGRPQRADVLRTEHREATSARFELFDRLRAELTGLPPVTQMQMFDLLFYLPNDMLVKVDRASMAHGLEVRVPFLSRSVADLAFRIPDEQRFAPGEDKRILRNLMKRHFGETLATRRKQGFAIPLRSWMKAFACGPQAVQLLNSRAVLSSYFDRHGVEQLINSVRAPESRWRADRSEELFALLVFSTWWDRYMDN